MNRKALLRLAPLVAALAIGGVALAQMSAGFDLGWGFLTSGGGSRGSASNSIDDSLGQWAGGSSSSGARISSGFWTGAALATPTPTPSSTETHTPTQTLTPTASPTSTPTPTDTPSPGDAFEDDDLCSRASTISTNGAVQRHTFHDTGDLDWVRFTAEAHKSYIIETSNAGPEHNGVLFLYDSCTANALGYVDNAFGRTFRFEWNAVRSGTYYVRVQQHDPAIYGDDTGYNISVTRDVLAPSAPPGVRAAPLNEGLAVQWRQSSERDVAGYHVWFGTVPGLYSGYEPVLGAEVTYYELDGLENGVRYFLAVSSFDFSDNEGDRTLEISAIPRQPPDETSPVVAIQNPTAGGVFTTTQSILTLAGTAQDDGRNLSRARAQSDTTQAEKWDYSLAGQDDVFHIEGVRLEPGPNVITATVFDDAGNQGQATVTIQRLAASPGAAIIVAGHNDAYGLQTNINNAANRAYSVFCEAGFDDDHIYYLAPTSQDPDGDGVWDEVDAITAPDNVQHAIETWAAPRVGAGQPLYVYLMDHGELEYFCADGCGGEGRITPAQLDQWIGQVESASGVTEVNIVIEACHSGSFIDRQVSPAQSISKAGRVVITSTDAANNAYASAQGAYFSDAFFSCVATSGSLQTCFLQARDAVTLTRNQQTPWIDDNGDGQSTPLDGAIAGLRYVAKAFGAERPVIADAHVTIQAGDGTLGARVQPGSEEIALVWAAIYAPSFSEPTATTLELGVPLLRLDPVVGSPGRFLGSYPGGFAEAGEYQVVFYAQDKAESYAQPRSVVVGGRTVHLPLAMNERR